MIASFWLVITLASVAGCATRQTLDVARGKSHRHTKENEQRPEPAAYAFIPITVALDAITLPFQGCLALAVHKKYSGPHRKPANSKTRPATDPLGKNDREQQFEPFAKNPLDDLLEDLIIEHTHDEVRDR
jgi:hypothetical protein